MPSVWSSPRPFCFAWQLHRRTSVAIGAKARPVCLGIPSAGSLETPGTIAEVSKYLALLRKSRISWHYCNPHATAAQRVPRYDHELWLFCCRDRPAGPGCLRAGGQCPKRTTPAAPRARCIIATFAKCVDLRDEHEKCLCSSCSVCNCLNSITVSIFA